MTVFETYLQIVLFNCYEHCHKFVLFPLILKRDNERVVFEDFNFKLNEKLRMLDLYLRNLGLFLENSNEDNDATLDDKIAAAHYHTLITNIF